MGFGPPLVVGSCLGGNFVHLPAVAGLFFLLIVIALQFSLDTERVLFESNERELKLLLDAETLE